MRHLCDGHEYRTINLDGDVFTIRNNYGTDVATLERSICGEYWVVTILQHDTPEVAKWHENDVIDNLLEQNAVMAYVSWAMDNETVEEHC